MTRPTLPDPRLCGCGERIPSDAAWKRHVNDDGCTLAGRPRRVCEAAAAAREAS